MKIDQSIANLGQGSPQTGQAQSSSRDEFLKLLVAQLEQQNPLDPQSGAEFVAQLAQFASVEQSAETNRLLGDIQAGQIADQRMTMAAFVGKTATVSADSVRIEDGGAAAPELSIQLSGAAKDVEVIITDESGKTVRTMKLGPQAAGELATGWNGTDDAGVPLGEGTYHIEVRAHAKDGTVVDATSRIQGVIDAVDFSAGQTRLRMGGAVFSPADVLTIQ